VVQLDTDEFGKLRSATPEELNIRARQEWGVPENINVYETDPLRVFAHQAAYYVEEIAEYRLIADLKAALPLVTPEFGVLRTLGTEAFSQRATRAEQELINILDRLSTAKSQATTDAQKSRIENAINKLTEDPATISALMLDIRAGVPEEVNRVGSLVAIMKRAYEEAGKAGIPIDKETRKLLTSGAGLIDERVTVTNAQQLAEMGLGRITGSVGCVYLRLSLTSGHLRLSRMLWRKRLESSAVQTTSMFAALLTPCTNRTMLGSKPLPLLVDQAVTTSETLSVVGGTTT
jgi:transcriptional regulator